MPLFTADVLNKSNINAPILKSIDQCDRLPRNIDRSHYDFHSYTLSGQKLSAYRKPAEACSNSLRRRPQPCATQGYLSADASAFRAGSDSWEPPMAANRSRQVANRYDFSDVPVPKSELLRVPPTQSRFLPRQRLASYGSSQRNP